MICKVEPATQVLQIDTLFWRYDLAVFNPTQCHVHIDILAHVSLLSCCFDTRLHTLQYCSGFFMDIRIVRLGQVVSPEKHQTIILKYINSALFLIYNRLSTKIWLVLVKKVCQALVQEHILHLWHWPLLENWHQGVHVYKLISSTFPS